jgi:hypothetical protein
MPGLNAAFAATERISLIINTLKIDLSRKKTVHPVFSKTKIFEKYCFIN